VLGLTVLQAVLLERMMLRGQMEELLEQMGEPLVQRRPEQIALEQMLEQTVLEPTMLEPTMLREQMLGQTMLEQTAPVSFGPQKREPAQLKIVPVLE